MYDGYRKDRPALTLVVVLMLGLVAGCSGADGSSPDGRGPVGEVSAERNYTTATGSLMVGDPTLGPGSPTEVLPPAVVPEIPGDLDGGRITSMLPVGVTDVMIVDSSTVEYRLAGNGPVSYTVRYVDEAIRYSTSEPLAVPGKSALQVDLSGTSPESDDTFSPYAGPERVRGDANSALVSVDFLAGPGGISQSFIGVAADRPEFTVTTTEEPAALIVTVES